MAYSDEARIVVLEGLVKDLSSALRKLCDDYALIAGTTAENLLPLKADLDLIKRANGYFDTPRPVSPALARSGAPVSPLGLQSPSGPHTTP